MRRTSQVGGPGAGDRRLTVQRPAPTSPGGGNHSDRSPQIALSPINQTSLPQVETISEAPEVQPDGDQV